MKSDRGASLARSPRARAVTGAIVSPRLVFLCGLMVMVAFSLAMGLVMMPQTPALTHDSAYFLSAAENLVSHGRFVYSITDALSPEQFSVISAYMPGGPAYPLALALPLALGMDADTALYLLTLLGLVSLVSLIYTVAWFLTGSLWGALIAGVWVVAFAPILDVMTYALTESIYIPLSVAVILVSIIYLRREESSGKEYLVILSVLMSLATLMRAVGVALQFAIGLTLVAHSIQKRQRAQAVREAGMILLSLLPTGLYLAYNYRLTGCVYCGSAPVGIDTGSVAITRSQIVVLLLEQFAPQLQIGLGFRSMAALVTRSRPTLVATLVLLCLVGLSLAWRYRRELKSAFAETVAWERWPIITYVMIYLSYFFWVDSGVARLSFNYPRYLIPVYPFIILLAVTVGRDLYIYIRGFIIRSAILLVLSIYLIGNVQATASFVMTARQGRGIEAPAIRDHPAIAYVRQTAHDKDLIFSTKAPTLWYYLRKPVRRLDAIKQLSCQQLQPPQLGGRSIFVLFPFYVYDGEPTELTEIRWFQGWIKECGEVLESRVFTDTTVYVVQPRQ